MKVSRDLATKVLDRHMERFEELLKELDDYPKIKNQVLENLFLCSVIPQQGTNKVTLHLTMMLETFVGEELPNIQTMAFHLLDFYWIAECRTNEVSNKMLKLQAQAINKAILGCFFEQYSYIVQELTSASFWNNLSEFGDFRTIHPYQQVKIQNFLVNRRGIILEGNGQYLPAKADRAKLCRKFSEQFWIPDVREIFVRQFLSPKETVIPKSCGTKPMHIGWYQTDKAWDFSGIQAFGGYPAPYGNTLMREAPCSNPYGLSDLLAIAPYHVTVPLFCYGIFSVIKTFVPDYPARISQKQPFNQVIRHRDKIIFLSLNGRQASELAQLFYGAFTDYGSGQEESKPLLQLYQSRVHDGVVVYEQSFKNLEKFRNGVMIQDACVAIVNSTFEENDAEIKISIPEMEMKFDYDAMCQVFPQILVAFLGWLKSTFIEEQEKAVAECWNKLLDKTETFYRRSYSSFTKKKLSNNDLDDKFKKLRKVTPLNWNELKRAVLLLDSKLTKECTDFGGKNGTTDARYDAFKKKQAEFIAQIKIHIRKEEKHFYNKLFDLDIDKKCSKKMHYLSVGLEMYQKFSQHAPASSKLKLPPDITDDLLSIAESPESDIQTAFYEYLSFLLEKQRIIPVRSGGNCSGWYDAVKHLVYLPHATFYDDFKLWYEKEKCPLTLSKRAFLEHLHRDQLLIVKDNGSKYRYQRSDFQIVVEPTDVSRGKTVSVAKIKCDTTRLSTMAQRRLSEL